MKARRSTDPAARTLEELMQDYAEGDARAFDELYRRLAPRLFGYLLRLTHSRERAEDLLQTSFGKIHRARGSYVRGAPLLPWVMAIARRSFYDERRYARVRSEDLTRDGNVPEAPERRLGVPNDVSEALDRALAALPARYREALELTKDAGLSISEAAEVLGTTPSAVKLRIHRAYKLLRRQLQHYGRQP